MTIREQAEIRGLNPATLRKHNSDLGIKCEATKRREVIERRMFDGTPEELSTFLWLYHGWKVTPDAVRAVIARIRARLAGMQFAMWPATMFTVPAPKPRIVHWHKRTRHRRAVQLSLDLFPTNAMSIAA